MKTYLFYILLIFPLEMVFSQTEKEILNNTNNNSIELKNEKKKTQTAKTIETTSEPSEEPVRDSGAKPLPPAPATRMEESSELQTTFEVQKVHYWNAYLTYSQQRTQRSFTNGQMEKLDDLLRKLSATKPGSFESYLYYYINGQNDISRSKALMKANELKPKDEMVQKELMVNFQILNQNEELRKVILNLSQNDVYPESVEWYGEEMLNSVPEKGVLIVHGKEDAYAGLYAQKVKRIREDVQIISIDWLTSSYYRKQLVGKGWKLPESNFIDVKYLSELCALNPEKQMSISLTLPKEYFLPILDKLYISGLVFEYKEIPTDLTVVNEKLWKEKLNKKLIMQNEQVLVKNYLPMLYQLKNVYQSNGNSQGIIEIEGTIQEILKR